MKLKLLDYLGCPVDRTPFKLGGFVEKDGEIDHGVLYCEDGDHAYGITYGVPRFPDESIQEPEGMHGNVPWKPETFKPPIESPPCPWESDSYYQRMRCLEGCVRDNGIKTVLDVGTDLGRSATVFSRAGCEVVTMDIEDRGAYGYLRREKNLYYVLTNDLKPPLKRDIKFDMVFIDTSHTYDHTKKEIEIYKFMATKVLGFDDIYWDGVDRAIKEAGIPLAVIGDYVGIWRK